MRGPWHFITCEYPPDIGGVSDFSRSLAQALATRNERVEVWAPQSPGRRSHDDGVLLHAVERGFNALALQQLSAGLDAQSGDRHLFIHWVPHGYGARGMNQRFCRWVNERARSGDRVTLMVHEPFLPLPPARLRHLPIALAQRRMMRLLLESASRVCVSTTAWLPMLEAFGLRPEHEVLDLPIASSLAPVHAPEEVAALAATLKGRRKYLVGHFGSFDGQPSPLMTSVITQLLRLDADAAVVLIGRNSDEAARTIAIGAGLAPHAVMGSGTVAGPALSRFIQACDLFVQPYVDGATTRRSTLATLLAHAVPVVTTSGRLTEPEWSADPQPVVTSPVEPEAIASAALRLLEDPSARTNLRIGAQAVYRARFDIDRTADRLLAA